MVDRGGLRGRLRGGGEQTQNLLGCRRNGNPNLPKHPQPVEDDIRVHKGTRIILVEVSGRHDIWKTTLSDPQSPSPSTHPPTHPPTLPPGPYPHRAETNRAQPNNPPRKGNYLFLDDDPWRRLRPLLDETVFVACPLDVAMARVLARQVAIGLAPEVSRARIAGNDRPNAELVAATAGAARVVVPSDVPLMAAGGTG